MGLILVNVKKLKLVCKKQLHRQNNQGKRSKSGKELIN